MSKVKVSITNDQTQIKVPVGIRLLIRRCCHAVLEYEGYADSYEVSVSFVDDEQIHQLNLEHRKIDRSTDVLSFPLGENGKYDLNRETGAYLLGDIVISLETAFRQAEIYDHSLEREIGFLTVHSMLHLIGYDHEESSLKERIMREKEEAILSNLGISRDASFIGEHEHNDA
ncbi:rRNA maturation RNase YbeY [Ruminococcus sp. FC2018]|uniref:rRNA maturation RNase YbeY n=1 Tax=Ruminococcus sp. FC2018 TaxID=1410617 RepID=UPI00048D3BFE|nr:rRNA maturation RNase YbeY [Ruminococcus sp. FC2018]